MGCDDHDRQRHFAHRNVAVDKMIIDLSESARA